jgi:hypothetical protein
MHITNKKRYHFAMSSFVRMYGHNIINNMDIKQFCKQWAQWNVNAPLSGLDEVDQYFYYEHKNWKGR